MKNNAILKKKDTLGLDPYLLSSELLTPLKSCENLPILTFADIYIYLIHNPSPYTRAIIFTS